MISDVVLPLELPPQIPDCLTGRPPTGLGQTKWYQAQLGGKHIAVVLMKVPDAGGNPAAVATAVHSIEHELDATDVIDIVRALKNDIITQVALAVAVRKALGVEVVLTGKGF